MFVRLEFLEVNFVSIRYQNTIEFFDKNEKKSEEVKDFWESKHLDQKLNALDKKRKIVEVTRG